MPRTSDAISATRVGRAVVFSLLVALGSACGSGGGGAAAPVFRLISATALSETQVALRFSAAVDPATLRAPGSIRVDRLAAYAAAVDPGDDARVLLDTFYQVDDVYTARAVAVRSATGAPVAAGQDTAMFQGAGGAALQRWDLQPPADLGSLLSDGWSMVDDPDATESTPSAWDVVQGALTQSSNLYGGDTTNPASAERPGAYFLLSGAALPQGFVRAVLRAGDDDGLGLILRYADTDHYYRFEWDRQRRRQRIVRVEAGLSTTLCFDTTPYALDQDYEVTFLAVGARLAVLIDGVVALTVRDSRLASGFAGLYTWGNDAASFRDVVVQPVGGPMAIPVALLGPRRPDAPIESHAPSTSEPAEGGCLVWVRAMEAASVYFEVSQSASFGAIAATSPTLPVSAASDLLATHEFTGLLADTPYFARAVLFDPSDPARRNVTSTAAFRTAPLATTARDLVFAFSADIHQDFPDRLSILARIAAHAPDFFVGLGDLAYCDDGVAATDLSSYRGKHAVVRSFDALEDFLRGMPILATWDDHEVQNDWDASTNAALVTAGAQAFRDYYPHHVTPGANGGVYRSLRWGTALELFLLDTRLFRSANAAPDGPAKSMLGADQKLWLLQALSASTAAFKCVATSVPLRGDPARTDTWGSFATERTEILDHITSNAIGGVFFIAGDQHWAGAFHHPEGVTEVTACPLSANLADPPAVPDPSQVFAQKTFSYGLVRIDAVTQTGSIEIRDQDGVLLHTEPLP